MRTRSKLNNKTFRRKRLQRRPSTKPSKPKLTNTTANVLISKISALFHQFIRAEEKSLKHFIAIGEAAFELKKRAGHGKFTKLLVTKLPFIDLRQIQRAMRLAKYFSFAEHEALYLVPKDHLEEIIKNAGKTNPMIFLEENQVDLDFDLDDKQNLQSFLESMKDLASKPPKSENKTGKALKINDQDEAHDEDETDNSKPQPTDKEQKFTIKAVHSWVRKIRRIITKKNKQLSTTQTESIQELIDELKSLVKDFGTEKDDDE